MVSHQIPIERLLEEADLTTMLIQFIGQFELRKLVVSLSVVWTAAAGMFQKGFLLLPAFDAH
ncbi:hypothetical protein CW749_09225 [Vibrio sp. vnigr-6D03]|nr:hypothetical protein CW749_09225 [Vibrio sp. vnigr-6D03]